MKKMIIAGIASASLLAASAASADTKLRNPFISSKRVAHAANESSTGGLNAATTLAIISTLVVLAALVKGGGGGASSSMMEGGVSEFALSDERLKTDIKQIGTSPSGIPVYSFRYGDAPDVYAGVMAQDLLEHAPDAIVGLRNGYFAVDYSKIDVDFSLLK